MIRVLIVDDQSSVRAGIANGVDFSALGVDEVLFAAGTAEAEAICREKEVDIAFLDVEMPGESGLVLNRRLLAAYPQMIRILLTSHAEFAYAQESTRTGCFDYILQPAPYEEIESCLKRALQELLRQRKNRQLSEYGALLKTNETELMDHMVLNLFSAVPTDVEESLAFLRRAGYQLDHGQQLQFIIIDPKLYKQTTTQHYAEKQLHHAIHEALQRAGIVYPVLALTTVGPDRRFTLLLFSALAEKAEIAGEQYQRFYGELSGMLPEESLACYVGAWTSIADLREARRALHEGYVRENVEEKPGIFFAVGEPGKSEGSVSLSESVKRWTRLLAGGQLAILAREVDATIQAIADRGSEKHRQLSELHQQLTHIFLNYFYEKDVDVSELFDGSYSYTDYMDSFAHTKSLRQAVSYMLEKAETLEKRSLPLSDVEKAKSFITENLAEPITVREIADHVGLSPEYFTKLFKQETGHNIKEYVLQTKIEAAKEMIARSDLSVSLVAMELGWSNFSHFTQVFKKLEGMTPTEYKSKMQGK